VGVILERKAGDRVAAGDTLATIHANDQAQAELAAKQLNAAFHIGPDAPAPVPLVQEVLRADQ
jgi:thymidine phosphorylase